MKKEFVMRGQTVSTAGQNEEVLNFSGHKPGYAFKLVEFVIFPSTNIGTLVNEMCASITAGNTAMDPKNPNFNDEGLIGTVVQAVYNNETYNNIAVINDTFLITQNLILKVGETSGNAYPVNWQCRFKSVKMTGPEEASTNYKQYAISDD